MSSLSLNLVNLEFERQSLFNKITGSVLLLLAFALPLSTSITSICMYLLLVFWFIDKDARARWQFYRSYPLTKPILILMGIYLLGIVYSAGSNEEIYRALIKGCRIGFIPILAYYLAQQPSQFRKWILFAFVAALMITILCTFLRVYGHLPIGQKTYRNDIFKDHIVISYFMAIGLLCLWNGLAKLKQSSVLNVLLLSLMGLILYYLVFLNTGRIGFIVLCSGFMVIAWHKYSLKGIFVIGAGFLLLMICAYHVSDIFSLRMNEFYQELQWYLQGKTESVIGGESSVGRRLDFAFNGWDLFLQHPILGIGTGSFAETYKNTYASQFTVLTNNCHNQYLQTAVEHGLLGLGALIALFYYQWQQLQQLAGSEKILAQSIFLSFYIGCLFNTWMLNFSEFHFYALMSAYFMSYNRFNPPHY